MGRVTGFELAIIMVCINAGFFVVGLCGDWGVNEYGQTWSSQISNLVSQPINVLGFQIPGVMAAATALAGVAVIGVIFSKSSTSGVAIVMFAALFWGTFLLAASVLWLMPWQPVKVVVIILAVINFLVFMMDLIDMSSG